jgi:hypothetical protein
MRDRQRTTGREKEEEIEEIGEKQKVITGSNFGLGFFWFLLKALLCFL